jgi:hypothetical protein
MVYNPSYVLFLQTYLFYLGFALFVLIIHDLVFAVYFLFTGVPLFLGFLFLIAAAITKDFCNAFLIFCPYMVCYNNIRACVYISGVYLQPVLEPLRILYLWEGLTKRKM